ncbi:hypothetical protein [Rhodococcus tibetensis]|uniref:Uncharacterized protein n=1 Tax=Rhodococcus tibetensis TaxID=2965064 RepID=A0ABT1QBF7_9NOCA|nr:hypothetical protein [Rhodococcus sp. FXJ9.536]MCQ4119601.1 hypothetical protein [Rhodococcus sp. FXJ9.536]
MVATPAAGCAKDALLTPDPGCIVVALSTRDAVPTFCLRDNSDGDHVIAGFDAVCGFHRPISRRDELLLRSDECDVGEVEGFDDEFSRLSPDSLSSHTDASSPELQSNTACRLQRR